MNSAWKVYIIQSKSGKLYTGITTDLNRRFHEHKFKKKGANFFHFSEPELIVYVECCASRSDATKKEYMIKKMCREQKLELINKKNR